MGPGMWRSIAARMPGRTREPGAPGGPSQAAGRGNFESRYPREGLRDPDHPNRQLCKTSLATVPKAKFLGILLNCVPDWSPARRAGADYYYCSGGKAYYKK
jgi:hypothetical protein